MFKDLDVLEFLKRQLVEKADDGTKKEILDKIHKYTTKIIENDIKDGNVNDEVNYQYENDLLDIINKSYNITIIANTLNILINALRNKENKNNSQKKSIKNNTLNKKTKTYDKNNENIQIKNDIEVACEKLNIKNKKTFNDTNIEIKGDYTRENNIKKDKNIP